MSAFVCDDALQSSGLLFLFACALQRSSPAHLPPFFQVSQNRFASQRAQNRKCVLYIRVDTNMYNVIAGEEGGG